MTIADLVPGAAQRFDELVADLDSLVDVQTRELCAVRIEMLLHYASAADVVARRPSRHGDADKLSRVAQWPYDPSFTARERACLAFTEAFVIDVSGITQHDVDELRRHLSPAEVYRFAHALWILEYRARLEFAAARLLRSKDAS